MKTFNGCRTRARTYRGSIGRRVVRETQLLLLDSERKPLIGGDRGWWRRKASPIGHQLAGTPIGVACDWLCGDKGGGGVIEGRIRYFVWLGSISG